MTRRSKITLSLLTLTVALGGCLYTAFLGLSEEDFAENVKSVDWLPESATNVSYYRSYSYTAYEFDISEGDFSKWAESNRWPVVELNGKSVAIYRHHFGGGRLKYPPDPQGPISAEEQKKFFEQEEEYRQKQTHKFSNGLHYDYRTSNGGGFTVGYDRDLHRAYYQSSPR